jgi:hypothetical protein
MLVGPPEAGKTTGLVVAGSVWGCHTDPTMAQKLGFGQPFNATDNDLEDELLAANHTLLPVDETRAAGLDESKIGKMLITVVMRWDAGFEKERKNAGKLRQAASVPFILTSNLSLGEFGKLAGLKVDGALHGRLISIPKPDNAHGVFEKLHGEKDVVAFARRLRDLARINFGYPSRNFLDALVKANAKDPDKLRAWLEDRRSSYLAKGKKIETHGREMNRIHEKMATTYAAACFAIKHGIPPWNRKTVSKSLLACTRDHVALVANEENLNVAAPITHHVGKPVNEKRQLRAQLTDYVRANREEIIDITVCGVVDGLASEPSEWPVLKSKHKEHGMEYLFSEKELRSIFGDKSRLQALKAALNEAGHIATEKGSGGDLRYSVKREIPGRKARPQFIAIKAAAVEGGAKSGHRR